VDSRLLRIILWKNRRAEKVSNKEIEGLTHRGPTHFLMSYGWPENVRPVEQTSVERMVVLSKEP